MKIYRIANETNDIILPAGTLLYHGTGEVYDYQKIKPGGYDSVFWTADSPAIAKTYIPVAGGEMMTDTRSITNPSDNLGVINLQKLLGINYDRSSFQYKNGKINSWKIPDAFSDKRYWDNSDERCRYVNEKMKSVFGYEPQHGMDSPCYWYWKIKMELNHPQRADYRMQGKLLTLTLKRDFKIWDKTYGGQIEGDLMDVDYHKINLFRFIGSKGYDGIKINDFCQSEDYGNVGHHSIGLFRRSLKDVDINTIDAEHEKLEPYFRGIKKWNFTKTKIYKIASKIKLYRGMSIYNKNGHYYTTDKEWARQFTQSGLDKEIKMIMMSTNDIYKSNPLPKATSETDLDRVLEYSRRNNFKAFWVDEGVGQPNSVYII